MLKQENKRPSLRLQQMNESATISMTMRARELVKMGKDVINMSLGVPDFDTPEFIKDAGVEAINQNYTRYSPVAGYDDLRKAICIKLKRDNDLNYEPSQIVVSGGVKHSLANLAIAILNPDDEVVILAPYWISYGEIVKIAGAKPVFVHTDAQREFQHSIEDIRSAITDKTRMLWFSTPNNPTGKVLRRIELQGIVNLMLEFPNILIVSDEIYEYILFEGKHESIACFKEIKDRVITVNGVSKGCAMTGWRIGYIAADQWIADACTKMQSQFTSGVCSISQKAAMTALLADPIQYNNMLLSYKERRQLAVKLFSEIEGITVIEPDGAFFIFLDISNFLGKSINNKKCNTTDEICTEMLNNVYIAAASGSAFGAPGYIRFSFVVPIDDLKIAVRRFSDFLKELK